MSKYLKNWESLKFRPFLFDRLYNVYGCGASALSTLLGENPEKYFLQNKKNNPYWPESLMLSKIRRGGYRTMKLTDKIVKTTDDFIELAVSEYHILLTKQKMTKNETSWQVIWGGYIFHNFEIRPLKPFEFINNKLLDSWVLKRKEDFVESKVGINY